MTICRSSVDVLIRSGMCYASHCIPTVLAPARKDIGKRIAICDARRPCAVHPGQHAGCSGAAGSGNQTLYGASGKRACGDFSNSGPGCATILGLSVGRRHGSRPAFSRPARDGPGPARPRSRCGFRDRRHRRGNCRRKQSDGGRDRSPWPRCARPQRSAERRRHRNIGPRYPG